MNLIVAVDQNWAIGKGGDQLVYISEDLKRFKALTTGHPVILGRKTLATFPGGRPLKGRRNLVLSTNPNYTVENAEVLPTVDALLEIAPEDAFVIGGESVYRALLPYCHTAFVTKIDALFPADRFFPNLDEDPNWTLVEQSEELEQDGLKFRYLTYTRI
jgi:dihydrofolate reductase